MFILLNMQILEHNSAVAAIKLNGVTLLISVLNAWQNVSWNYSVNFFLNLFLNFLKSCHVNQDPPSHVCRCVVASHEEVENIKNLSFKDFNYSNAKTNAIMNVLIMFEMEFCAIARLRNDVIQNREEI
ncbi:hypothetical protein Anas_10104 [Armadillidium nasatum]|uniref:Uncharacterized protein n=1 Tax=Armadillidium nasatum TaxID=96803 RepID=A0A5N5TAF9_9CRUS|nr:hypothetical protein Anas_10104 [Armadillidium nasatum]